MTLLFACAGSRSGSGKIEYVGLDEEIALGQEISRACNEQFALVSDPLVTDYLNAMASELGEQSEWAFDNYHVYIIDSTGFNHFSLPGGHIYLYRGLFDSTTTLEQTAMVLAHEIAHLADRDALDRIAREYTFAFAAQSVFGYNPEITRRIIAGLYGPESILNYSHKKELQADKKAVEYAFLAGINPQGLLDYLDKIALAEIDSPEKVAMLEMTHPDASKRIKTVRSAISKNNKIREMPANRRDPNYYNILKLLIK